MQFGSYFLFLEMSPDKILYQLCLTGKQLTRIQLYFFLSIT